VQHVWSGRTVSSRTGALALAIGAAAVAALLLVVYLRSYRNSVRADAQPASVLVAKKLIEKGTPGTLVAENGLYQVSRIPQEQLKDGAIADPAALRGHVASADIYPGQQFTVADFVTPTSNSMSAQITGTERAIAVSLDSAHGLVGPLVSGDHVDAYVNLGGGGQSPILKFLASDILVLSAPGQSSGNTSGGNNVVLRVPAGRAPDFALANDTGKIWLTLRPQTNSSKTPRADSSIPALLAGR
jgi:Flp pilus assembly protein CpaB